MVLVPSRRRLTGALTVLAGWPRRAAALLCLALALFSVLTSHAPPSAAHLSPVIVSARSLRPGTVLSAADVAAAVWPDPAVPAAVVSHLSDAVGHVLGAAMTRGEPVTAARLLDTGISAALAPGQVALTVSLSSGDQAAILQAGAVIDLYVAAAATIIDGSPVSSGSGRRLATNVRVLAVLPAATDGGASSLVIAADAPTVSRLADRPAGQFVASLVPPA